VSGAGAQAKLGTPCERDRDCEDTDFCFDPPLFGGAGSKVCSRTCCSSGECDPQGDFVCWVPDAGGGNFCRDSKLVGRPDVGTKKGGEICVSGSECRSGSCSPALQTCIDPCCSDTSCADADALCRLGDDAEGTSFTCQHVAEKKQLYDRCSADAECSSNLCITLGDDTRCSAPCCGSPACGLVELPGGPRMVACENVLREGTVVRACAGLVPDSGIKAVGEPCVTDEECRSARCVNDGKGPRCSDVCCTDASCGDPTSFACRAAPFSGEIASLALRCEPK
jgi:hypothetical protein